jgi:hypothetical protein
VYGVLMMSIISIPFNHFMIKGFEWVGKTTKDVAISTAEVTQESFLSKFAQYLNQFRPIQGATNVVRACKNSAWRLIQKSRLLTFAALSAYDPIPAMLFIKNVEPGTETTFTMTDRGFFFISTIIANGVWAVGIYFGIEAIQAMEDEIRFLVEYLEGFMNTVAGWLVGNDQTFDLDFLTSWIGACVI